MDHQKKSVRKDTLLFYIEIKTEVQIKNNNKLKRRIELIVHLLRSKRDISTIGQRRVKSEE